MRVAAVPFLALVALAGCAKSSPTPAGDTQPAPAASSAPEPAPSAIAPHAVRDAEPSVDMSAHLADAPAPLDPACTRPELDLGAVLGDARCATSAQEAKRLRDVLEKRGGKLTLRQEAEKLAGDRVLLRLVNTGTEPLTLPLSWAPGTPSFSAFAEAPDHAVYDLEPPKLELDAGADPGRGRFARIVLAPGGRAVARVAVPTAVTKRLAPPCEAGTCAPPKLPPAKYVLYVGELVVDVEAGMPARVEWTLP